MKYFYRAIKEEPVLLFILTPGALIGAISAFTYDGVSGGLIATAMWSTPLIYLTYITVKRERDRDNKSSL